MYAIDRPVRFTGTPEEAAKNRETHVWCYYEDEVECGECCAKPWHAAASYPCGVDVPRETVTVAEREA
jgi:hypothetical protein